MVNELDTLKVLAKEDSNIIKNAFKLIVGSDTLLSQSGCSQTIKYFDKQGRVIVLKSKQNCMSDSRMKWGYEMYFNENGARILVIYFDGLDNIIEVIHI